MKKSLLIFTITILTLFMAACGDKSSTSNKQTSTKDKITVYTTAYPLSYFTERIGGDFVEVSSIYPPGSNEHTFEPTQRDMMKLADADLFFYIGLGLEGFVENAKKTLANEDVKLIATSNQISDEKLASSTSSSHEDEDHGETEASQNHDSHDHGDVDPHVWLSPVISQDLALSIKNALIDKMPAQEAVFSKNYDALVNELQKLDTSFKTMADKATGKTFFVSHAAFGYIAGNYGLTQVPIAGLNSQNEPSQKELTTIVDTAKDLNAHYILFEQNVSSKLAEVIQKEIGAESLVLHNLSVLTTDDVKNGQTYFTLMEQNIQTLDTALNGDAR